MSVTQRRLVAGSALPAGAAVVAVLVWLVPVVVPLLLVLVLASLVRLGDSIFDRLMTALALGTGLLVVAALGFSLWPWGLDPLPVALVAWTGLWGLAVVTGRRPRLPRWSAADIAVPVTVLVALVPVWRVLQADGPIGRLAIVMIGEDNSRHLMWWRGIRESGAYLFLAGDRYPDSVVRGWDTYPQGWHLVAAALDRFGGVPGSDVDRYLALTLLTHLYLMLNVVWLAHVTRRHAGALHVVAAAVVGAALVTGSELFRPLVSGYPAESLGLSLAVAMAAVAGLSAQREPGLSLREPVLVVAAVVVATSFAYYVFLLPEGLLAAVWLWRSRREAVRSPYLLGVAAVAALALAAIMPVLGVSGAVEAGGLQVAGNGKPVWLSLIVLAGLALAGLVGTGAWRESPARWAIVAGACYFGFGAALAVAVQSGYYVHKIWHVPIAVAAAMCAALVLRLPVPSGPGGRLRSGAVLAGVSMAAVLGAGLTPLGPGAFTDPEQGTSNLGVWRDDFWAQTAAASSVVRAMDERPPRPGETSFVVELDPWVAYRANVFLSSIEGTSDDLFDVHYVGKFTQPDQLLAQLDQVEGRVRLLATSPEAAAFAEQVVAERTETKRVRVVPLRPAAD